MRDSGDARTDSEWVARARQGAEPARTALVERYHVHCLRIARHLLGDDHDAEEAVQDAFVRAFAGLRRYDERQTFRAWLFRIMLNRCRTLATRRARRRERVVRDERALESAAVPGDIGRLDAERALFRALEGLDMEHRTAFLLKVGEELEYDEMQQLTGASVSALKMRVKRARDHIREHWPGGRDA